MVQEWAENELLDLIHDPKLHYSFNSGRWKKGYNPDLIFVSSNISQQCLKDVCTPIPKTQHRALKLQINKVIRPESIPFKRRFNYKKANWEKYREAIDKEIQNLEPTPENYELFANKVRKISRQHIPRGCREKYIPGLSKETEKLIGIYRDLFKNDPFSDETITAGENLTIQLGEDKNRKWHDLIENTDMTKNSKKAWRLIKKLSGDPTVHRTGINVTANQVASELLKNGKPRRKIKRDKIIRDKNNESHIFDLDFQINEFIASLKEMKNGKAAGYDEITIEQIKHFGPVASRWLLQLLNT